MAHSYKTILKKIILKLGFGFKKDRIEACLGDEIPIELDKSLFKNIVRVNGSTKNGDVAIFNSKDNTIRSSNINSIKGLTKITTSDGDQKLLIETTDSANTAGIEVKTSGNGYPYYKLTHGNITWDIRCNPNNESLEFRPAGDLSKPSMLTLFPNGNCVRPYQPKATAYLTSTPYFTGTYKIGSTQSFTIIRDDDGYNTGVGNFFAGGNGNQAYYKTPYSGRYYEVSYQFLIQVKVNNNGIEFFLEIYYGDFVLFNRGWIPPNSYWHTVSGSGNLPVSVAGKKILFQVTVKSEARLVAFVQFPQIDNYVQIYMKD